MAGVLRLIYCLNNGLPLDIDVYDAAEWSSLVEASRKSVQLNGAPVAIPDFTRGDWDTLKEVVYHMGGAGATELKPAGKPAKNVYAQVADSFLKLSDPAGDAGAGVVDFIGGAIQVKGGNLELYYTAAAPIEQSKLSYHLKVLIAVGTEGGYDNAGTRYLVERGLLYRFNGDKPFQWKWEKITAISVRFQQQFCEMSVPLNLIAPEPDRISVRFRCLEDYMPNAEMPAAVLTPGNLAANPATKVDTSSSRERYSPGALNDGQISPELPWEKAAWASLETEEDKFITFSFPVKKQLKRVIIYWEKASREMLIQFPEGNGWKTVGTVAPGAGDRSSVVDLEGSLPETNQVRFLQTAGKGSAGRPQLVWIREIEIY